ncbi:T9SS type A sorting domain-containing protein [Hymenobacter monticola]|uniref:T9SS type A sorting domain-containing protein n=1 Tax=Hymenobacter monticola TaxID=1705399 RepID=A0ABY4B656_9BACT|nr:T9SS type A sorting domain-containing protein [Hymenobacter monticola]UOE34656.1 T9SS type A sorting domain-containing protein [Hymenobacter monticola]
MNALVTLFQNLKRASLGLLLVAGMSAARAQAPVTVTATVGTGTSASSTNVLLSTSTTTNKYARTVSIFSAAELAAAGAVAGNIVSIAWLKGGTGELTSADSQLNVYMKSTSATLLAPNPVDWATEVAGATAVYSNNTLSLPTGVGYKTFTLSTPFAWNGTSNVEVLVDWYRNGTPTADISWQYTAVGTTGIHATQVNSSAIPTVRFAGNRPNTQFVISRTGLAARETREAALVSLYPNPAHGVVNIAIPAELAIRPVVAALFNALGQEVGRQVLPATVNGAKGQVDTSHLKTGIYTLRLSMGSGTIAKRLVIE